MPWWFAVAERDHVIQNPTNETKIRALGDALRLTPDSEVLDVACGKAGPAIVLAKAFGCRITGVERAPEFAAVARDRVSDSHLEQQIDILEADARTFELPDERYDAALCLGATFVWDDLAGTLAALVPTVKPRGAVAVGEPFWRRWPVPADVADDGYLPLADTAARFDAAGLELVTVIASNDDDWDHYESQHWRAVQEWLSEHPHDPDAPEFRERLRHERDHYIRRQRDLLGWAIFVARKR